MRFATLAQAVGITLLLATLVRADDGTASNRAERAAERAEAAATRSEDAARRVESAASRLERLVDRLEAAQSAPRATHRGTETAR